MLIKRTLSRVANDTLMNSIIGSHVVPRPVRTRVVRRLGHTIGPDVSIASKVFLGARTGLTLGAGTFVNVGCFFDLGASTTIGARCNIGYDVMFVTCTHKPGAVSRRAGADITIPIVVGDGVWIGARALIMPGVTIGEGCVVAAGSVVIRDCEPHHLYAGTPAVRVKALSVETAN